jgi:membrane-associated phospholipid phosphatase
VLLAVKHAFDSLGTAFPSSHAAAAVATALALLPLVRPAWRVLVVVQAVLVLVACVYTGNHYAVDVVAGATVALVVTLMVMPLAERITIAFRPRNPNPG